MAKKKKARKKASKEPQGNTAKEAHKKASKEPQGNTAKKAHKKTSKEPQGNTAKKAHKKASEPQKPHAHQASIKASDIENRAKRRAQGIKTWTCTGLTRTGCGGAGKVKDRVR